MNSSGPRPGRPRDPDSDRRIHDAVLALLRERGPQAVTVESVASTSGVAKTTIYRRFADRQALLEATLRAAVVVPEDPPDVPPREKLRWAMDLTWRQMGDVLGRGGLAAVVGDLDPDFTALFRSVLTPSAEVLVRLVREDVVAGELRADLDADAAVSLLVGAYLGELLRRGEVAPTFAERCLDLVWTAMSPLPPGRA
ncbi:TetR/AcrR family transcriptional regulator [Nocardioides dongxiaopingii]|uniref:TetR/AcrR family transcriptional regulator n=1 Tax=Nocardioides dongxiaopingii TaxID=2576036 RepID=UPI0010C766B3|nr:TetR/AcrR family transcriptional regulator [Nocardioides dongxiaopingii]